MSKKQNQQHQPDSPDTVIQDSENDERNDKIALTKKIRKDFQSASTIKPKRRVIENMQELSDAVKKALADKSQLILKPDFNETQAWKKTDQKGVDIEGLQVQYVPELCNGAQFYQNQKSKPTVTIGFSVQSQDDKSLLKLVPKKCQLNICSVIDDIDKESFQKTFLSNPFIIE